MEKWKGSEWGEHGEAMQGHIWEWHLSLALKTVKRLSLAQEGCEASRDQLDQ